MPRRKENRTTIKPRVDTDTPLALANIAQTLGYTYNSRPSVSKLLDAIAKGEVLVLKKISEKG
jgi:hypothetical protein